MSISDGIGQIKVVEGLLKLLRVSLEGQTLNKFDYPHRVRTYTLTIEPQGSFFVQPGFLSER